MSAGIAYFPLTGMIKALFPLKLHHSCRTEIINERAAAHTGAVTAAIMQCSTLVPHTGAGLYFNSYTFLLARIAHKGATAAAGSTVLTHGQPV